MLPKVNEAFARPLYIIDMHPAHLDATLSQAQEHDPDNPLADSESEQSLMEISSESASSTSDSNASMDSFISID